MSGIMRRVTVLMVVSALAGLVVWLLTPSADAASCPNEAFRIGASASLPNCRAYEMVSPPEANGRMVFGISGFSFESAFDLFPTELASPGGNSIVFETLNGPLSSPLGPNGSFDIYETQRTPTGWQTMRRISPSGPQSTQPTSGGVSSDHRYAFTHVSLLGLGLVPGSFAGEAGTDYLGNPDGSFELTGQGSLGEEPLAQGRYISEGGKHVIFSTGDFVGQSIWCQSAAECEVKKLESDAAPEGTGTVYDREADGPTHVVSLLPPNVPQTASQQAFYKGASKDGSTIAFTIEGTLYVRLNSGEAGEETVKAAEGSPVYAGLSDNGKYLFYVSGGEKGTIHRFDTETDEHIAVNPTSEAEVVNVSANGSHVYFISKQIINGEGTASEPNLFAWDGTTSTTELVATVVPSDLEQTSISGLVVNIPALTRWTSQAVAPVNTIELGPGADSSRTTPTGKVIVFESRAKLTAYDNTEATEDVCADPEVAGEGCTEIYRWEEGGTGVECISCKFGSPASADARLQELESIRPGMLIHNLSADGSHVFFETSEPLSTADTDGVNDIYEWTEESGISQVDLISSGRSVEYRSEEHPFGNNPRPNLLYSVTPDGSDVVFLSQDNLTGVAGPDGVPALYDARVNGGFPPASQPPAPCAEEGCRQATTAPIPSLALPQSKNTTGPGNVKPRGKHPCHRKAGKGAGARKGKPCSKNHSKRKRGRQRFQAGLSTSVATVGSGARTNFSSAGDPRKEAAPQPAADAPTTSVGSEFSEFGIEGVAAGLSTAAAGHHPDFTTFFKMNYHLSGGKPVADARPEEISISLPPGLLGNPNATPKCSTGEFLANGDCPFESQVGISKVLVTLIGPGVPVTEPLYNLTPPHPDRELARFGFYGYNYPVYVDVHVRTDSDYGVTATVHSAPGLVALLEAETTIWGDPSNESHDTQRMTVKEAASCGGICGSGHPVARTSKAFMSNSAACQAGEIGFAATSYQLPGQVFAKTAPLPPITNCQGLPFAPSFSATPTTHKAGAATGLQTTLVLPQHLGASEPATATMREARVTLPQGMGINPGAANWIDACSDSQVGYHQEVDAQCPDGSKLGTATIKSPALSEPIQGALYQRQPTPGHQLGLWLVADALGLHIKLPGSLEPDNKSGRLTAVFSDLPQVPVEEIDLNVWGGPRAPLTNPASCGAYQTTFSFAPHSNDPAVSGQAPMQINEGCDQPFSPKLKAGTTNPKAGAYSPLIVDLERPDGDQALRGFELKLPDGLLAKIKGVGRCTDAQADAGSCPADSKLGTVAASAGSGPDPLWIPQPGKPTPGVYLGGPYEGSPLSVITLVPAQAGPFDLGVLVVRSGLGLDPETNRPVVKADPLPQFFEGALLTYRRLHVTIDRPKFTLNPTDCRVMAVDSDVTSTQGAVAHPQTRFKVNGCKRLGFKPSLKLELKGGTERSDYPALTATLKARRGDANIARARVELPHSEFLAQEHIQTICTRKQFAAKKCPKGSVYGAAKAWTPLLAKPLSGPVYLRSSDNPLPDMVAALSGELDVNLVGRIDSHNGGIRTTFASVPDAPVTRFVLRMKGGAKGLLVNSTDVCRRAHKATADFTAQNGRAAGLRPVLGFAGCGKGGKR